MEDRLILTFSNKINLFTTNSEWNMVYLSKNFLWGYMDKKLGRPLKDLTGKTYGRLHVINKVDSHNKNSKWACECECGGICIVMGKNLIAGITKSCGCIRKEKYFYI